MEAEETNDKRTLALDRANDPSVRGVGPAHEEHLASLQTVFTDLDNRRIRYDHVRIDQMTDKRISKVYDAAIGVGGDGTIIDVGKRSTRLALLGVNSAPSTSHGPLLPVATSDSFWRQSRQHH